MYGCVLCIICSCFSVCWVWYASRLPALKVYLSCPYFVYVQNLYHKSWVYFIRRKFEKMYTENIKRRRSRANKITHSTAQFEQKKPNELAKNDKWLERLYLGYGFFCCCLISFHFLTTTLWFKESLTVVFLRWHKWKKKNVAKNFVSL